MSFLKGNKKGEITTILISSLLRLGGGLGAAYINKSFLKPNGTNTQQTLANLGNPLLFIAAGAGELLIENKYAKDLLQGMGVVFGMKAIATAAPSIGESFGLSGTSDAELLGTSDAELLGIGTTAELPEEFADVDSSKFLNDGNKIDEMAENIDNENYDVQVAGTPYEEDDVEEETVEMSDSQLLGNF
jgi:hypothetical protein